MLQEKLTMNIFITLLYLLSLANFINSSCSEFKPRKEGFLRKPCIPGYYEGSCLLILPRYTLYKAIETCQNEYGGRLATAPTEESVQQWIRTIHFNHHDANANARYWVGYGRSGFRNIAPKGESRWANVFKSTTFMRITQWENGANKDLLDDSDCQERGTVFNPASKKFDVKSNNEEHYALCETVRWAKLQCNTGWYLLQPIRMCVNVHLQYTKFLQAHATCNSEGSFIATGQNGVETEMLRKVITPLDSNNFQNVGGFWAGIKSEGENTFSMDGTIPLIEVIGSTPADKSCVAFTYKNFDDILGNKNLIGAGVVCENQWKNGGYYRTFELPYMCQRFADQSSIKNIR